ncbi:Uncharacterised protein [Mycobacterium tuberculosis]|nr:Uncharacterised protein [Mycobacterium tuberculosis]
MAFCTWVGVRLVYWKCVELANALRSDRMLSGYWGKSAQPSYSIV